MMITPPQQVLILGSGSFAEEVADVISEIPQVTLAGFVENQDGSLTGELLRGLPIYWVDQLAELAETHTAICGLGTTFRSRYVEQVEQYDLAFTTLVHPSARVSTQASLAEGTFVSTAAVIASYTTVGKHVSVNRAALIGHHTQIGPFVTVGPGANIAGNCRIGQSTYIGMSAVILDHISVGSHSVIGAGAVVTRNVPDNVQVVGVPAGIVKENIMGR